jgi:hypothetical protein
MHAHNYDISIKYISLHIFMCAVMNKKSKILQQTFTADNEGQVCYMILLFMEGDKVIETVSVRLYNNFHLHDKISHYQFYAFSSN